MRQWFLLEMLTCSSYLALTPPDGNVYIMKTGRGYFDDKQYSTRQLQELPFSRFNWTCVNMVTVREENFEVDEDFIDFEDIAELSFRLCCCKREE